MHEYGNEYFIYITNMSSDSLSLGILTVFMAVFQVFFKDIVVENVPRSK